MHSITQCLEVHVRLQRGCIIVDYPYKSWLKIFFIVLGARERSYSIISPSMQREQCMNKTRLATQFVLSYFCGFTSTFVQT